MECIELHTLSESEKESAWGRFLENWLKSKVRLTSTRCPSLNSGSSSVALPLPREVEAWAARKIFQALPLQTCRFTERIQGFRLSDASL